MKNPNRPDVPELPDASIVKNDPNPPPEPITLPPGWEEPDEWWVDWWSKGDHEDIMTYLIFAEDGSIIFKVVHEGDAFDDFPDSTGSLNASLYTVDASLREKLFSSFLKALPADEPVLRYAFAKAIKKALEPSTPKSLLESKGIPFRIS